MKKRNLFAELTEGLDALAGEREGKITLCKIKADVPDALEVSPAGRNQGRARSLSRVTSRHGPKPAHQCAHVSELGTR